MEIQPALDVRGLYYSVPGRVLLDKVDLSVLPGEAITIMGPSGSGKSTFLNCLAGIMVPSGGSVTVDGTELTALSVSGRAHLRLRRIGVVFQFGELLPELTVLENGAIPMRLQGRKVREANSAARAMLARLDVASHADKHPSALSGGEVQRVGIARALAHAPALVLADEPTGAVDEGNAGVISDLLIGATRESGAAVVIATHDAAVAARGDRSYRLRGGALVDAEDGDDGEDATPDGTDGERR